MKHRLTTFCLLLLLPLFSLAQNFNRATYYSSANGKKGAALRTAMGTIINKHTSLSYDALWDAYLKTDKTDDGYIWDMYSCTTKYVPNGPAKGKSYNKEGDSYNREHSFPQSWFDDRAPMKTDLYHVVPTDGYVNNRRSNYAFGEVGSIEYQSNKGFSKLGSPTAELRGWGCSNSRVFEPNDIYKGDFARTYFYMLTCYESQVSGWSCANMTSGKDFSSWAKKLLLKWAEMDKVSEKETDRIEAVYALQNNRNPYIDFPGLEQYIWGTWADSTFSVTAYRNPYEYESGGNTDNPDQPDTPDNPDQPDQPDTPDQPDQPEIPAGDYALLTEEPADWTGIYLITYTSDDGVTVAMDGSLDKLDDAKNNINVTVVNNVIASTKNVDAAAFSVSKTTEAGVYAIQGSNGLFFGRSTKKNGLETADQYSEELGNRLRLQGGNAVIEGKSGYVLRYNPAPSSGERFRYYTDGSQKPVRMFRKAEKEDTDGIAAPSTESKPAVIYDLMGRRIAAPRQGIYIMDGRKVVVK